MFGVILRALVPILAGLGVGKILDKTAADKLPQYPEGGISSGFETKKIIWFAVATVIGTMLIKFISRKTRIKIL